VGDAATPSATVPGASAAAVRPDHSSLTIREATPGDADRILELVRLSLGEGSVPRDATFWSWKHRVNPFGESPILLAESDGLLVGLRAFLRWEWRRGGRTYRAVRAVDTATHPDFHGQGIFSRLTLRLVEQMRDEGVSFVFNTPNSKSGPGYIKMGWRSLGRTSLWVRPLRLRLSARRDASMDGKAGDAVTGDSVDRVLNRAGLHEWLAALPGDPAHFRTPRTIEYLRWRYAAVPGIPYGADADMRDGGAAVVHRLKARGRRCELRICELLVGQGRGARGVARRLLREACARSGADFASAMAPFSTAEASVLLASGFIPVPRLGPVLTIRPLAASEDEIRALLRRSSWGATIGDLEVF